MDQLTYRAGECAGLSPLSFNGCNVNRVGRGTRAPGRKYPAKMIEDVYDLLARDITNNVGLDYGMAIEVVDFLRDNDFIDYDTLREIYVYDNDDEY